MTTDDQLIRVFAEVLDVPVSSLTDASNPDDTGGWDSAATMEIIVVLEETFGVQLEANEIAEITSIGAARTILRSKGVSRV